MGGCQSERGEISGLARVSLRRNTASADPIFRGAAFTFKRDLEMDDRSGHLYVSYRQRLDIGAVWHLDVSPVELCICVPRVWTVHNLGGLDSPLVCGTRAKGTQATLKVIVYDNRFNANEWSVIISLCIGVLTVFILPKRFTKKTASIFFMCGVFFGFLFDHTLSVLPVSFYDVNDTSRFQFMDFLSYLMYGPYSYLFFYLYDRWRIKPRFSAVYIIVWSFLSTGFERLNVALGVFHYTPHGYNIFYSFVIYLAVASFWVVFYYAIKAYGDQRFGV